MSGILYGVGVGPGDPELLTIKALRILKESDIIALPAQEKEHCHAYQIVKQNYPEIEEKELLPLSFPMTKDAALLQKHHEENAEKVLQELRQGKQVAFLTNREIPVCIRLFSTCMAGSRQPGRKRV